jgi:voltage-gated potassium channel
MHSEPASGSHKRRKLRVSHRDNFAHLTWALLALLLVTAAASQFGLDYTVHIVDAATVLALAAGIWSIRGRTEWVYSGVGLILALAATTAASYVFDEPAYVLPRQIVLLLFLGMSAWVAIRQEIFSGGPIDGNKLIGALCVYLLVGLVWAVIYSLILHFEPRAFAGISVGATPVVNADLVYFSFVCLTTLGIGDIVPVLPVARFFVYLEAVVGQFYLAVVVAILVGSRLASRRD